MGFARFHSVDNFFKACRDSRVVAYLCDKLTVEEGKKFMHVTSTKLTNSPAIRESIIKFDVMLIEDN